MRMYSLLDVKTRVFGPVVLARTDDEIKRQLYTAAGDASEGNMLYTHPQDFNLMFLGFFDQDRGVVTPEVPAVLVENVGNLVPSRPSRQEA